ncbi:MAG: 2'-5' RNA ligase [Natronomonas sp.]|jgi:2'-5' RNA ligase|uniref:RNA 2',3'-cyclic phosphodiesterase n=1 Tax=Natronomonas sp. TaxID=2184060 RepID=UPI0039894E98
MRLFVSVDIDDLAPEVAEVQAPFRELSGLNLTDPEQAHITMKFLGEADHDLDTLTAAIETAVEGADVEPFDAEFEGLGVFPSLDYISVIWLGVEAGSESLTELHEQLELETTGLGYEEEQHEFTPHVTLARMDHAGSKDEVQRLVQEEHPEVGTLNIGEVRLTESTLTQAGTEYETVERFEL